MSAKKLYNTSPKKDDKMKASQNRSPKLFDQMLQELRTPSYALRTERTYIDWERSDSRVRVNAGLGDRLPLF